MLRMFRALLGVVLSTALAVLVRSLLLPRAVTVVACLGLAVGVIAAFRGRVWGLYLIVATAVAFAAAAALGSGPGWFWAVAATALLPVLPAARGLLRADALCAIALGLAAAGVGASATVGHYALVHAYALRPGEMSSTPSCTLPSPP